MTQTESSRHVRCFVCDAVSLVAYVVYLNSDTVVGYRCGRCSSRIVCNDTGCMACRNQELRLLDYRPTLSDLPFDPAREPYDLVQFLRTEELRGMLDHEYSVDLLVRGQRRPRDDEGYDGLGRALYTKLHGVRAPTTEQTFDVLASRFRRARVKKHEAQRMIEFWITAWDDGRLRNVRGAVQHDHAIAS